jgi:biotin carboxylase
MNQTTGPILRLLLNHTIAGAADLIDLMRRARPDLHVIATHERRDTPIALCADRFLPEPVATRSLSPEAYESWLLGVAKAEGATMVLPYRRRDELLASSFEEQGIRLLTASDPATMRLLENKPALLSRMDAAGTPVTPFRSFEGLEGYARLRDEGDAFPDHPGPFCVKPASGIYGAGFRIIRDELPATAALSGLSTLELPDLAFRALLAALPRPEPMMLMPFFTGPERSIDFACLDGRLLGTVTRVKEGASQRLCHDPYAERLAERMVGLFKLTGVLNLQTIEDSRATQLLMEVNTRTSGGIGMTGLTDVNLPALLLEALEGAPPRPVARVTKEVQVGRREVFWAIGDRTRPGEADGAA